MPVIAAGVGLRGLWWNGGCRYGRGGCGSCRGGGCRCVAAASWWRWVMFLDASLFVSFSSGVVLFTSRTTMIVWVPAVVIQS